jgi:hypothetical protein
MITFPLLQENIESFVNVTKDSNPIHQGPDCIASAFQLDTLAYVAATLAADYPITRVATEFKAETNAMDNLVLSLKKDHNQVRLKTDSFSAYAETSRGIKASPKGVPFFAYTIGEGEIERFTDAVGWKRSAMMFGPSMASYALLNESPIEEDAKVVYTSHSLDLEHIPQKAIEFYNLGMRERGGVIGFPILGVEGSQILFKANLRLVELPK